MTLFQQILRSDCTFICIEQLWATIKVKISLILDSNQSYIINAQFHSSK